MRINTQTNNQLSINNLTTMKNFLIFLFGVFVGVGAHTLWLDYESSQTPPPPPDPLANFTLFDEPGELINIRRFQVHQVTPEGHAIAHGDISDKYEFDSDFSLFVGMRVVFMAEEGSYYYNDQIISAPKGKKARQVGIYKEPSMYDSSNITILPVVAFCDK